METPVYLRWVRPLLYLAHRFGNGSSFSVILQMTMLFLWGANDPNSFTGTPLADWPKQYAFGSRPADIADEYRAVLISCPSRIRNQTILFCLSPTN